MRPGLDEYLMQLAEVAATRTTCVRKAVGCVLADGRGRVLAIGYNGVPSGVPHCNQHDPLHPEGLPHVCEGHSLAPGQDSCMAVHAEQNALLQCASPDSIATAYVTLSPCKACLKLLMNTGCRRIVFRAEHSDPWPSETWQRLGRAWEKLEVACD